MNKTINTTYNPKTISAIQFMEPEKALLLKEYFGGFLPKSTSIPTVNLTLGIISSNMCHFVNTSGEYYAIKKSCDSGYPLKANKGSQHEILDGCIFAYVADLPMAVLRDIMRKRSFIETYDATILALEEEEESIHYKENYAKLKKIIDIIEEK